jgi:hypothetical protein
LAARIRAAISRGELPPGQVLPNLDAFAAQYGVGRTTAQHALKQLADEGWLLRRRRAGTVVNPRRAKPPQYIAVLTRPLLLLQGSPYNCLAVPAIAHHLRQADLRFRFFHGIMLDPKAGLCDHLVDNDLLAAVEAGNVQGVVVVGHIPPRASELIDRVVALGLPMVECGLPESQAMRCPVVMFDYWDLARRLVESVARCGARRIATLAGPTAAGHDIARAVKAVRASHRAIMPSALHVTTEHYVPALSYAATLELLKSRQRPDAIVVFDDLLALGVDDAVTRLARTLDSPLHLATQANLGARLPYRQPWKLVSFDPWEQMAVVVRLMQRLLARQAVPRSIERLQPVDAAVADELEHQRNTRGVLVLPLGKLASPEPEATTPAPEPAPRRRSRSTR